MQRSIRRQKRQKPKPPPLEVGCHAHCRRKFTEAEKYEPDDSKRVLSLYKKLYKVEAEIKGRPLCERMFRRQEESVPLLNELFNVCSAIQSAPLFLPKTLDDIATQLLMSRYTYKK